MLFNLGGTDFTIIPQEHSIESIMIFGSFVRGDNDYKSDIDFLFLIDNCSTINKAYTRLSIAEDLNVPISWVSIFTLDEFSILCSQGAHFLWSLKLEGEIIYSKSRYIECCLDNLPIYLNMKGDILNHNKRIDDLSHKLRNRSKNYGDAIVILGQIVRNILMILCYTYGYVSFNKYEVMDICDSIFDLDLPFSKNEYYKLLKLKENYKYNSKLTFYDDIDQYIWQWIHYTKLLIRISFIKVNQITSNGFISPFIKYI